MNIWKYGEISVLCSYILFYPRFLLGASLAITCPGCQTPSCSTGGEDILQILRTSKDMTVLCFFHLFHNFQMY